MPTLNWIGKDKVAAHRVPFHVLNHLYNFGGSSGNKIIHGDNLLALRALLPEYEGRVKCIYIDPPYNTGNEAWVYNDRVNSPQINRWLGSVVGKEGEDLSRHDKWLCMMFPRLKLLKRLLAPDGAIFISIDDNEQANLKLICDEIFGAQNFVANVIWQKKGTRSNDARWFSDNHDFILVYAKEKFSWRPNLLPRTEASLKNYANPDNDPRGLWQSLPLQAKSGSDSNFEHIFANGVHWSPPAGRFSAFSHESLERLERDNRIWFGDNGKNVPRVKKFLSEVKAGFVPTTIWLRDEVGDNQEAKRENQSLNMVFDSPKPPRLIEKILRLATGKDSIVLDSFAGSGTTAHAVLNLNAADGGERKFILVEMEDYAERITAERVRRVIGGYGNVAGTGGSFDFYEVGEPLMIDGDLNAAIDEEQIRAYIWHEATGTAYRKPTSDNPAYLGTLDGTGYYFVRGELNAAFISTLAPADSYVIYGTESGYDDEELRGKSITFKKIPRNINRGGEAQ